MCMGDRANPEAGESNAGRSSDMGEVCALVASWRAKPLAWRWRGRALRLTPGVDPRDEYADEVDDGALSSMRASAGWESTSILGQGWTRVRRGGPAERRGARGTTTTTSTRARGDTDLAVSALARASIESLAGV